MHEDFRAKRAAVHHGEIPLELITNSTEKEAPPKPNETTPEVEDVEVERIKKNFAQKIQITGAKISRLPLRNL